MPKMRLRPVLRPGPHWGSLQRSPDLLAGFKVLLLRGGQGRRWEDGKGKEGDGREKGGGERKWGREGKGSYQYFFFPTSSPAQN